MDVRDLLLFALGHYTGLSDKHDDDVADVVFATRLWCELELSPLELGVRAFSPSLPGLDYFRRMHREQSFLALTVCCRSFWHKLSHIQCCSCDQAFTASQFHKLRRTCLGGARWFLHEASNTRFRIRRGSREPRVDWREGSLRIGHLWGNTGFLEGGVAATISPVVLFDPDCGCKVCEDRFDLHPHCQACFGGQLQPAAGSSSSASQVVRFENSTDRFFR